MDSAGKEKEEQGTQSNPKEEQPQNIPGKEDQCSGEAPTNSGEQPKSNPGKEEQNSGGTQTNPEEQPKEKGPTTAKAKDDDAKMILNELKSGVEPIVVLIGDAGTGKTWLARQVTKSAVSREGPFYMYLWVSLKKHDDQKSVLHSLALQLSIPTTAGVWEDEINGSKKEDYADRKKLEGKIKEKLKERLTEMDDKRIEHKTFLLLVLDSEEEVKFKDYEFIENLFHPDIDLKKQAKFLMTTRKIEKQDFKEPMMEFNIQPFSGEEAKALLEEKLRKEVSNHSDFGTFCHAISERSKVLPAQVIMLAEALNQIANGGSEALEHAFFAALSSLKHASKDDPIPLLHFTYESLPDDCMKDCFWHSWNFLKEHGGVQYNSLIAHWILEGHLDLAAGVKAAYEKGYDVMMKLIDRGILKMQEDNLIVLEGATLTLDDHSCRGLFEKSNLGLASVLKYDELAFFERMAPDDGVMKTVGADEKGESLLIDGSRLCREVTETFFKFEARKNLKVLALFSPRLKSLPKSISEMNYLAVLVLRDCYLLNDIEGLQKLEKLVVLEISGSPFLEEMPEIFFEGMSQLRILNLSALGIKALPLSFSKLTELRRLILRRCSFLETLPKLVNLKHLEVIDLSGSCSLTKLQEKSFKSFIELRFIDFSETKIEKLPIVQTLPKLAVLLVTGCDLLYGLRCMKHLKSLKVFDVSGATRIKEIYYDSFDDTNDFRILDLSKTEIRFLPDSLGKHLCDLRLRACPKLEKLPTTTTLTDLESLDLSNCSALKKYPDKFFETLPSLQSLDLSNTKVPSLPCLTNLRKLLLKGCLLEKLPDLGGCAFLVELDLSNCKIILDKEVSRMYHDIINHPECYEHLSEVGSSFEHMSRLQVLNLSETHISSLPSLPKRSKLHSLTLRNCIKLKTLPDFTILPLLEQLDLQGTTSLESVKVESLNPLAQLRTLKLSNIAVDEGNKSSLSDNLKNLEVLDLSGEAVESLPSLDGLSNLKELLLGGCSSLKELPSLDSLSQLKVLDLSGTKVENLREKISKLTHLKRLRLPEEKIEEFKGEENINLPPLDLKLDRCCISKSSDIPKGDKKRKIIVQGSEIFKSLKEDRALLESIRDSISSVHSESKDEDNYGDSRKHMFGNVYSDIRKLPPDCQSLEIHGFDDFPTDIEIVLEPAEYVLLVENNFQNLSAMESCSLKNIKGLWLERCNRIESIFMKPDVGKWEKLEILWISNLPKLKSLYDEKVESPRFGNLKQLNIDCCPMLESVFSSAQLLGSLEILQIKFCDRLKSLYDEKVESPSFGNLKQLYIDCCPMLESVFSSAQLLGSLEILQIKFCDRLKSLSRNELVCELLNLHTLHLLELPSLKTSPNIGLKLNKSVLKKVKVSPNIPEESLWSSGNA